MTQPSPNPRENTPDELAKLCERLGAPPGQALVMAKQLLKRADQLAVERGTAPEVELSRLLELLVKGRSGEVPKDFVAPPPLPPRSEPSPGS